MSENTIKLSFRGMPGVEIEAIANADMQTGMLAERDSNGEYGPHSAAAGFALTSVTVEEPHQGGYGKTLDQAAYYEDGDRTYIILPRRGDVMWMWLEMGASVLNGAALESNGSGMLQALTGANVIGLALEPVDATAAAKRIKVEIS